MLKNSFENRSISVFSFTIKKRRLVITQTTLIKIISVVISPQKDIYHLFCQILNKEDPGKDGLHISKTLN